MNYFKFLFLWLIVCSVVKIQAQEYTEADLNAMDSIRYFAGLQGDYYKAITYGEKSVLIAEKLFGKDSLYSVKVNSLAQAYYKAGELAKAEKSYLEAQKIRLRLFGKKHMDYISITSNMALLYTQMGQFEKAEQMYLEVKSLFLELFGAENPNYNFIISNMGLLYYELGRYEESEAYYLEAKKNMAGTKDFKYAQTINDLGNLYRAMERYEEAELMLKDVLALKSELIGKMHPSYATSLNNMASLYNQQGRYLDAMPFYKEALDIRLKVLGKENIEYAISLANLAMNYVETGKRPEAIKLLTEANQIRKKALGEQHPDYASGLANFAGLYADSKDYTQALLLYNQALSIYEFVYGKEYPDYAKCLINIGYIYMALEDYEKSISLAMSSLAANSPGLDSSFSDIQTLLKNNIEFYSKPEVLRALELIFKSYENSYQKSKNNQFLKNAFQVNDIALHYINRFKNDFIGENDKLSLIGKSLDVLKQGISTAYTLEQYEKNELYIGEALKFFELNKSAILADAVKGQRAKTLTDLPDALLIKEMDLQRQKTLLQKKVIESKNPQEKLLLQTKQNELNQEINAFLKEIMQKFPKYHALKYENITTTTAEIQKILLDAEQQNEKNKTMLLEYFVSDTIVYLFAATKNKLELHTINITKNDLKVEVEQLRRSLSDYHFITNEKERAYEIFTTRAYWFYEKMLKKALENKEIDNLVIITDGELGHLPFETFLTTLVGQSSHKNQAIDYSKLDYLVKKYNISYNYSATLWKENKNSKQLENNGQILACAASYDNKKQDSNAFALRSPHLTALRSELQPLPSAKKEIETIANSFQGLFLQNDSTNEAFFKAQASQYGIIHLAMHGILNERVPILSSLAFTENHDSIEDNFLQAYEIAHLKLNADLVVLSACETGYGKFTQGEGVMSLARSFMYAGVPSLVVSLWQVNDYSTAEIMKNFYHHLSSGMPKDAALRQAKLDYIQMAIGIAAHPAFWSAFIQLGDNRPIEIAGKTNWIWWGLLGLVCLAIVVVVVGKRKKEIA